MVTITVNIPDNMVAELSLGFLRSMPIPTANGVPTTTLAQWVSAFCRDKILREYRKGKMLLAQDLMVVNLQDINLT